MTQQLKELITEYNSLQSQSQYDDLSDLSDNLLIRLITRSRAAIERISGKQSPYVRQTENLLQKKTYNGSICRQIIGIVDSLLADVEAGYLKSHEELIHGELFSDFIDMSRHLINEGYKDPAAVIVGSALETHLRNLCIKFSIDTTFEKDGKDVNKKADKLNSDLAKGQVYSKLDQKNITAWLDLRNKAAHGHFTEYTKEQVILLIDNISNFIVRNPA